MQAWETFYVIVGAAGGALIGVQFVVMTLVATIGTRQASAGAVSAFATPTVVHFSGVLLISVIVVAPWPSTVFAAAALALCGVGALAYAMAVRRRVHRQTTYETTQGDWLWYVLVPWGAYVALVAGALLMLAQMRIALFIVAAAAVGLLLLGIRNAWDTVTYLVLQSAEWGGDE